MKPSVPEGGNLENEETAEQIIAQFLDLFNDNLDILNFEDTDWEDYTPRHNGYIPEYEAIENMAEDDLTNFFEGWHADIITNINQSQLLDAACIILGTYDGCINADIPGANDVFGNFTDTMLQYHKELIKDAITTIKSTIISHDQAIQGLDAVFGHYLIKYAGDKGYLKYFEPLLISLTETKEIADYIIQKSGSSGIDESWLFLPFTPISLQPFFTIKYPRKWTLTFSRKYCGTAHTRRGISHFMKSCADISTMAKSNFSSTASSLMWFSW